MTRTILITGGTGFLGRRLGLTLKDKYMVFLSGRNHDQNRLAQEFSGCPVLPLDVSNIESVRDVVSEVRPEIVIHAAAAKYVDTAERSPMECLDVNILGSQNLARVAVEKSVQTVIGISTDKAAPPVVNTYGLTKALMERVFCTMNGKTDTRFTCVRFGNMPWSTGSFLPVWKRMHESTGVIGTTGSEMTRLFTLVDDAVTLVTTAIENINQLGGKILCRELKSARIGHILDLWIRHKGGDWKKIEGRPGERHDELLIGDSERAYTTEAMYSGTRHYIITPNHPATQALPLIISSADAPRFSDEEILAIINNPPKDVA